MNKYIFLNFLGFFSLLAVLPAKEMIRTPPDFPVLGELEPLLERLMLTEGGADASLATVLEDPDLQALIKRHELKLFGGPMLGQLTANGAVIWLRTIGPQQVDVLIRDADGNPTGKCIAVKTQAEDDFTGRLKLTGLQPQTDYTYRLRFDSNPTGPVWPFRTAPRAGDPGQLRVAFGGGARYNPPKEKIWDVVRKRKPDAFLWLGDNLYIDKPESRSTQRLYYYRRQLRPEFQRLTASTANYAIWDDHDFGDNDVSGGTEPFKPAWKLPVWRVFKENWPNPGFGNGEKQPGCWYKFQLGEVEFFMTDGRYYRDFKKGTMLGPVQKKWLLDSLKASTATFKVIASGTLWTETADKGGADSWWGVPEEREEIFHLIDSEKIGGVILISADRHRTDVYKIERPNGYTLYEFETSKLTNNHTHKTRKPAIFSYNKGNFYGLLTFDTNPDDPTVSFECITMDDESVYKLTLPRSQLQAVER